VLGRRLDRYVTFFFVWHFLLCLVAIVGLYVVVDTFSKLDDFVEHEGLAEQIRWIATYPFYQIPVLLSQFLLPVVTLLAGIISLARLARYNELNAMKAAGVSIHRTLLPIFLASLVIGALAAANQEVLIPYLESDIRQVRVMALKTDDAYNKLHFYDAKKQTFVFVQRLDNAASGVALRRLEAEPRSPADSADPPTKFSLRCARAIWVDRWLYLFDGAMFDSNGQPQRFTCRTVLADDPANEFSPPPAPPARLTDGAPAYRVGVLLDRLNGKKANLKLDLRFASHEPISNLRLICGGHITSALKLEGEETPPPLHVQTALWQDGKWRGRAKTYRQVSERRRAEVVYNGDPPLPLGASPSDLVRGRVDHALESFAHLREMADRMPRLRQRIVVELHGRLAFPLASFVLLLIGIPLLFQQEGGKSTWLGVGLALFVSVCFYVLNYACRILGQSPAGVFANAPALAGWLPILVFGVAGAVLLGNMDT